MVAGSSTDVVVDAHPRRARRVQRGLGVLGDPVEDLLVGLDRRAGRELAAVERRERRLGEDVAGGPDRLDPLAPVFVGGQVVEPQRRVLARVGRGDLHASPGRRSTSARCAPGSRGPRRAASRRSGSRSAGSGTSGWGSRRRRCCGRSRRPRSGWWRRGPLRRNSHSAPIRGRCRQLAARARSRPAACRRTGCRPRGGPAGCSPTPGRSRTTGDARAARARLGRRCRRAAAAAAS